MTISFHFSQGCLIFSGEKGSSFHVDALFLAKESSADVEYSDLNVSYRVSDGHHGCGLKRMGKSEQCPIGVAEHSGRSDHRSIRSSEEKMIYLTRGETERERE